MARGMRPSFLRRGCTWPCWRWPTGPNPSLIRAKPRASYRKGWPDSRPMSSAGSRVSRAESRWAYARLRDLQPCRCTLCSQLWRKWSRPSCVAAPRAGGRAPGSRCHRRRPPHRPSAYPCNRMVPWRRRRRRRAASSPNRGYGRTWRRARRPAQAHRDSAAEYRRREARPPEGALPRDADRNRRGTSLIVHPEYSGSRAHWAVYRREFRWSFRTAAVRKDPTGSLPSGRIRAACPHICRGRGRWSTLPRSRSETLSDFRHAPCRLLAPPAGHPWSPGGSLDRWRPGRGRCSAARSPRTWFRPLGSQHVAPRSSLPPAETHLLQSVACSLLDYI